MEDPSLTPAFQCHLQGIQSELRVKAVRERSAAHVPGKEIHDLQQEEKSSLQRDGGDDSRPDLVHCRDLSKIHKAGVTLRRLAWVCGSGLLVDRP